MSEKINQVEPNISEQDIQRVSDYMSSGAWITEHALTKELEDKIADFVGAKYAVSIHSATSAIFLSMLCGIGGASLGLVICQLFPKLICHPLVCFYLSKQSSLF